jgi:hypothetical protein
MKTKTWKIGEYCSGGILRMEGSFVNVPPLVHFTLKSGNVKTGKIPVSTSGRSTCPDSCPLKKGNGGKGCYGEGGPLSWHWNAVDRADRGTTFEGLCDNVSRLPQGQIWRHNQVGDLPGDNNVIAGELLEKLTQANTGKRGFTYTHKPVLNEQSGPVQSNRDAIAKANRDGFTINLSANGLAHADKLAELGIGPVVTILPDSIGLNTQTPKGRRVVVCPAQTRKGVTCETCKLCSRGDRSVIVGFIPHGTSKKKVAAIAGTNS